MESEEQYGIRYSSWLCIKWEGTGTLTTLFLQPTRDNRQPGLMTEKSSDSHRCPGCRPSESVERWQVLFQGSKMAKNFTPERHHRGTSWWSREAKSPAGAWLIPHAATEDPKVQWRQRLPCASINKNNFKFSQTNKIKTRAGRRVGELLLNRNGISIWERDSNDAAQHVNTPNAPELYTYVPVDKWLSINIFHN